MKHKLSEAETRKVFIQLFQGIKYLVSLSSDPLSLAYADARSSMSAASFTATSSQRTFSS